METYSRLVLLLFHPYGQASDIILNQSHTLCLRSAIMHCLIGDEQQHFYRIYKIRNQMVYVSQE